MMEERADKLIAALWRAIAHAMVPTKELPAIYPEERKLAIRVGEHVEQVLRLTGQLYKTENNRTGD